LLGDWQRPFPSENPVFSWQDERDGLPMKDTTSVVLNVVRFMAALVVFIGHLAGRRFTAGVLWPFSAFMDTAVIAFFVLSGYVIGYVSDTYETTLRSYTINRVARVSSVALPALLLTIVLDTAGRQLRPDLYNSTWGFSSQNMFLQYLEGLTFTTRIWFNQANVGSMLPYWSLAYEVWYYAIFAAFWYLNGARRIWVTLLLCVIAGPSILSLFPLWCLGLAAYHIEKSTSMRPSIAILIFLATVAAAAGLAILALKRDFVLTTGYPVRYAEGFVFFLNLLALSAVPSTITFISRISRPAEWLAGLTFSLYLIHLPIAQFLTTISHWKPESIEARILMLIGTMTAVVLFAEVTERRKRSWRLAIASVFPAKASVGNA
jgi:peptidoglycan/LPS O-acetylase OafA/YrhL